MMITVEAVYEDGVLKPAQPLPLHEKEKVKLSVTRAGSLTEQTYGMLGWKGNHEAFERVLKEAEEDYLENG